MPTDPTTTVAQLQTALAALHDIARADWRGPKPAAITVAEVALRHMGACDCHPREAPATPSEMGWVR